MIVSLKRVLLLLSCLIIFAYTASFAENWKELKGEHFVVYYYRERNFAKETLNKAEEYYRKIADELGYARYKDFWQWQKRVKIYIYPDFGYYRAYLKAEGYAMWSVGMANYKNKEIISYANNQEFIDTILPHEITHLIFRDYVGQENIPIWIDEGVAQWQEKGKREMVKSKMKQLLQYHSPISIKRLTTMNIGKVNNEVIVELFYVEAISIIDFLITHYGVDNFIFLCRQLRDGKDMDEALKFAYPMSIRNARELETKWLAHVQGKESD